MQTLITVLSNVAPVLSEKEFDVLVCFFIFEEIAVLCEVLKKFRHTQTIFKATALIKRDEGDGSVLMELMQS